MKDGVTLRVIGPVAAVSLLLIGLAVGASVYLSRLQEKTSRLLSENVASVRAAEERESDLRELQALTRWLTLAMLLLGGGGVAGGLIAGFLLVRRRGRSFIPLRVPTHDPEGQEVGRLERRLQQVLDFARPPRVERQPVERGNLDEKTNATPGGSTTSTTVGSNSGPCTATNVMISDPLPADARSATWSGNGHTDISGALSDTVASLAPGVSLVSTTMVQISPSDTSSLVNMATVLAADSTAGSNSASEDDTLLPQADLLVAKDDGVNGVVPDASDSSTLLVTNNGPSTVSTFTLPAALLKPTLGTPSAGSYNSTTDVWSEESPASGQSLTITVSGTIGWWWLTTNEILSVTL